MLRMTVFFFPGASVKSSCVGHVAMRASAVSVMAGGH